MLYNKTTSSLTHVTLTGFWNPTSCAWLLGLTAASGLLAMASGIMVGFKTAFFSFRLRTNPSSGKGKQEGLLRPNSVKYKSTAPHRSLQSCEVPKEEKVKEYNSICTFSHAFLTVPELIQKEEMKGLWCLKGAISWSTSLTDKPSTLKMHLLVAQMLIHCSRNSKC